MSVSTKNNLSVGGKILDQEVKAEIQTDSANSSFQDYVKGVNDILDNKEAPEDLKKQALEDVKDSFKTQKESEDKGSFWKGLATGIVIAIVGIVSVKFGPTVFDKITKS